MTDGDNRSRDDNSGLQEPATPPFVRNGDEGFQQFVLNCEPLIDLLVNRTAVEVEKRRQERHTRFWNRFSVLSGIFGVALATGIYIVISGEIERKSRVAANESISEFAERLEKITSNLRSAEIVLKFRQIAETVETEGGVDNDDERVVTSLLEQASGVESLKSNSEFIGYIESLVYSFAQADAGNTIDEIDDSYQGVLSSREGIVGALAQHYGMRLLRTPNAPTDWKAMPYKRLHDRYNHYIFLAKNMRYPEVYLLFRSVEEFLKTKASQSGDDTAIIELLAEIDDLNETDRPRFFQLLREFADFEAISLERNASEFKRLGRRVREFMEAYQDRRPEFKEILEGDYTAPSNQELDPSLFEEFQQLLEESQPSEPSVTP